METTKVCTKCKQELPLSSYSPYAPSIKVTPGKLQARCRGCVWATLSDWRRTNPDKFFQHNRRWAYKNLYGITLEDYDKLLEQQNGGCAICGDKNGSVNIGYKGGYRRLAVDHDHSTGKVRGLLCDQCSRGIGHLKNFSNMRKAISYLERYI